jgi:hypothetical protein
MASIISAGTSTGSALNMTGDTSGALALATNNGTTALTITTGQQVQVNTGGSASAPVISKSDDTNTGIFFPAADTIAFTEGGVESMRIDSSGNVGIGTSSPANKLSLGTTTNGGICLNVASRPHFGATYSSDSLVLGYSVKPNPSTVDGMVGTETNSGAGAPAAILMNSGVIQFHTATSVTSGAAFSSERMRIDSSGNLLVAITATQNISGVNTDHTFAGTTSTNRWVCGFINSSASSPYGLAVSYTGSAPNATGNQFLFCRDTGGTRFEVRSNGGIANYSANNVNLSDAREKTNVELAGSYLNKICNIPVKTFNYIDQNLEEDGGLTLGVVAQDVQAVAPELVNESDWSTEKDGSKMRLSIYQTDLQYALMKSIQELKVIVDAQAVEIAALKTQVGA